MSWQPGQTLIVETERVILRSLGPVDMTPEYIGWWNDDDLQEGLGHLSRKWTKKNALEHLSKFDNTYRFQLGIFMKPDRRFVGFYTVSTDPTHRVSSSTTLIGDPSLWRMGLAKEISERMIPIRFENLGVEKIEGKVRGDNKASKALYESLGFKKEGVLIKHGPDPRGGRIDITLYGLLKDEWLETQKKK